MGNVKVYSGGVWFPPSDSPGILTKGTITSTFSRGAAAMYVPDNVGGWSKLTDLIPAQPTSVALTNDGGRIVVTWNIGSTANLQKYQIYSATAAAGPYTLHATQPTPTGTSESFVFGRLASAPGTRHIFVRSVAPNGLYQDSSVSVITIPGVNSWASLSHSRGASGWHGRSFTFTAGVSSMGSLPKTITSYLYRRANTSEGWTHVATYADNDVYSHTKTFSFSSNSLGQQMFRVLTYMEDKQTKQDNGTTGAGYSWSNDISTTELTAADITGTTPIISASALGIATPPAPVGSANGTDYGYSRSMSVTAGFPAWTDRSEFTSFTIRCYNMSWGLVETKTLTIANLKSNQSIAQTETVTFDGLARGTNYIFYATAFDPGGGDPEQNTGWVATVGTYSNTWSQYTGTTTSEYDQETRADTYFSGQIVGAPWGPMFNPSSYNNLKDYNTGTYYVTGEDARATTGVYERIRFYNFQDTSVNYSSFQPGSPGYLFRFLRSWTPQSHNTWQQVYDHNNGDWLGSGADPSAGNNFIGNGAVNNNWFTTSFARELGTTQSGASHYCNFDVRIVLGNPRTYGSTFRRFGLSEISVGTRWRSRFDNYETRTYYW